jgi:hypothetical protein
LLNRSDYIRAVLPRSFLIFIAAAQIASAEWVIVRQSDEPLASPNAVHRHVEMGDSARGAEATVDLALFPAKSCKLRVIDNQAGADLSAIVRQSNCVAAVNGGYFDPNFAPIGLRIIDGVATSPLKHGQLMSGVAASNGVVQLVRLNEFVTRHKYSGAIECGPFLVDGGKAVRGLETTRAARRTFVGIEGTERAVLGVCSDVPLAQIGQILSALKFRRAMNLDGGSSTAFWCKRADGTAFSVREYKNVRDFVGIAAN